MHERGVLVLHWLRAGGGGFVIFMLAFLLMTKRDKTNYQKQKATISKLHREEVERRRNRHKLPTHRKIVSARHRFGPSLTQHSLRNSNTIRRRNRLREESLFEFRT